MDDLYLGILAKAVKHHNEIFQDIKYQQLPADIQEARAITTVDPLRFFNGTHRLSQWRLQGTTDATGVRSGAHICLHFPL
jgi:hypothetical protein